MNQDITQAINNAQAILFDFDGIILDSEWPIFKSCQNLFEREGHELAQDLYVNCIGSDFEAWSPPNYLEDSINGMHAAHQAEMKVLAVPNRLTHILDFSAAHWQHYLCYWQC